MIITDIKKNYMIVSRAATAIYLILKAERIVNSCVVVPANLCYAAIYPILYTGNYPLFCDVDPYTGNVDDKLISMAVRRAEKPVAAVIVPHMYGKCIENPVMMKIVDLCRDNELLLIEDCASSLGASDNGIVSGSYGDYSLFSFGYSKTIDLGGGGLLLTDRDIDPLECLYMELPEQNVDDIANEQFFSRVYRLIRNEKKQTLYKSVFRAVKDDLLSVFVYRQPWSDIYIRINDALKSADSVINVRRRNNRLYEEYLMGCPWIIPYKYSSGDVPWRFSFFVEPEIRESLIVFLLEKKVPISDWYPSVMPVFGEDHKDWKNKGFFDGITYMEERILNLPLIVSDDDIKAYTDTIISFKSDI